MFSRKAQPPIKSLLAQGSCIEGELRFAEGLRIDGTVVGDVRAVQDQPSLLVISETACVEGEVHADHVIINGTVRGPVHAAELLELLSRARIEGEVSYGALEVHPGAVLAGHLQPLPTLEQEKPLLKLAANNE